MRSPAAEAVSEGVDGWRLRVDSTLQNKGHKSFHLWGGAWGTQPSIHHRKHCGPYSPTPSTLLVSLPRLVANLLSLATLRLCHLGFSHIKSLHCLFPMIVKEVRRDNGYEKVL